MCYLRLFNNLVTSVALAEVCALVNAILIFAISLLIKDIVSMCVCKI